MSELPESLRARYRARRVLGAGGFGQVVLADDTQLDRSVAIKLLHVEHADEVGAARFEQEAVLCAGLEHPAIVRVYDHGRTPDGALFIVYEHVPGRSMEELLEDQRRLPALRVAELGIEISEALAVAHEAGVVHRDVKPANVMLRDGEAPVLLDFGIARPEDGAKVKTAEGMILGTPRYMAPELWRGAAPSPASDQYAWCASLYQALCGQSVMGTDDIDEIVHWAASGARPRVPDGVRRSARGLAKVLERGLAPAPGNRFPHMRALAEALRRHEAEGEKGSGEPTVLMEAPPPAPPSRRLGGGLLLASVCLVGVALGLAPGSAPSPPPPPSSPRGSGEAGAEAVALRQAYERLMGFHQEAGGSYDTRVDSAGWQSYYPPRFEGYLDPRLPPRWRRLLEAGRAWLATAPLDGADAPTVLKRDLLLVAAHLDRDLENLIDYAGEAMIPMSDLSVRDSGLAPHEFKQRISERREAVHRVTSEFLTKLPRDDPGLGVLALGITLEATVDPPAVLDRVVAARRRFEKEPDSAYRYHLGFALLAALNSAREAGKGICEPAVPVLEALEAGFELPHPKVRPEERIEVLADTLELSFRLLTTCRERTRRRLSALFERLSRHLEAEVETDPLAVRRAVNTAMHVHKNVLLGEKGGTDPFAEQGEILDRINKKAYFAQRR